MCAHQWNECRYRLFQIANANRVIDGSPLFDGPGKKCAQCRQMAIDGGRLSCFDRLQILFVIAHIDRRYRIGLKCFAVAGVKPIGKLVQVK